MHLYVSAGDATEASDAPARDGEAATPVEGEEEEEEETCGFCIFMKAGGCKDAFNVREGHYFRGVCFCGV